MEISVALPEIQALRSFVLDSKGTLSVMDLDQLHMH